MTEHHADNCDYHCDQYPWECTCGVSNPKEPDTMIEETQTTIPEGETAPLPASADLPTAATTMTENAANAPVQTVGVAMAAYDPGPVITAADADSLTIANVQEAVAALTATNVLGASAAGRAAAAAVGNAEIEEAFAPALHAAKGAVEEANDLAEVEVPREQPEDFGKVAFEAVEHAVETVVEEAETLASEAVSEVKKVWNNHLQAWV